VVVNTNGDGSTRRFEIRCDAHTAALAGARTTVEKFATDCGFDEKAIADIGLCVNEAMANVIRHAYLNKPGQSMVLTGEFHDGELRLRLRDWGSGVNPEPLAKPPDPLRPGGLGLVCLKSLMDETRFIPQTQGMLLEMVKRIRTQVVK
jgi:anti-sigma regulatory factor (Ser/Thr protein kinase)